MMTSGSEREFAGDLVIDDLDHPFAVSAAFTYCG